MGERRKGVGVSLAMIVRDERNNLRACLSRAADLFDELIVVDTGSTDDTCDIARSFGAFVHHYEWCDDFSCARNYALDQVSGAYVFWLDADDRIEETERAALRSLLNSVRSQPQGVYLMRTVCEINSKSIGTVAEEHVRLFPHHPDIRWTGRVHETLTRSLLRTCIPVMKTEITIRHVGYLDPAHRTLKEARNKRLLLLSLQEDPDNPVINFYLAWQYLNDDSPHEALSCLSKCAPLLSDRQMARKLFLLKAKAHCRLNQWSAALDTCQEGLRIVPDSLGLLLYSCRLSILHENFQKAETCFDALIQLPHDGPVPRAIYNVWIRWLAGAIATAAEQRGDNMTAFRYWSAVVKAIPKDRAAKRARGRAAIKCVQHRLKACWGGR